MEVSGTDRSPKEWKNAFNGKRLKAKRKGKTFLLNICEYKMLYLMAPPRCPLCNTKFSNTTNAQSARSIDRIDCLRGYEIGNCIIICRKCNMVKRKFEHLMTPEEAYLKTIIERKGAP